MKRSWVIILLAVTLLGSALPSANAVVTPGTKCSKAGIREVYKGKTYTCIKSGNKLVWNNGVKVEKYDAGFAAAFLAKAQDEADQILADAELKASQISTPPNCSKALVSIGGDPSTGVIALIFENPTPCDLVVRASAEFYCPRGRAGNNTVISKGTFSLKARAKLYVSLNPQRYFPLVTLECAQLTGYTSNTISVANELTRRTEPRVAVESSVFSGGFNQAEANKKANEILKSAKSRASKLIADAKNPAFIAAAWNAALEKASSEASAADNAAAKKAAADKAASIEKAAADKLASIICIPNSNCPLGSTGPGGGIVFYDAGSQQSWGRYLEVAPAGWSGSATDPAKVWCNVTNVHFAESITDVAVKATVGVEIGKGKANTNLMLTGCSSGAGHLARAYRGGGQSDWYLPSRDELNEMCKYAKFLPTGMGSDCPTKPECLPLATLCKSIGTLREGFSAAYPYDYWSSSETDSKTYKNSVWVQLLHSASLGTTNKSKPNPDGPKASLGYIRPIRAI